MMTPVKVDLVQRPFTTFTDGIEAAQENRARRCRARSVALSE
jgi:hypothetical protein